MSREDRMMKKWLVGALAVALVTTLMPSLSEAKRLGGGKSQGMQRSMPDRSTPQSPPAQSASPQPASPSQGVPATAGATAAAAAPAAAAAKRSWMGPIAGLAAGLGIAALLSHFGLGEGLIHITFFDNTFAGDVVFDSDFFVAQHDRVVQRLGARLHRLHGVGDHGQRLVFDHDRARSRLGQGFGLGCHGCHGFAHPAHLFRQDVTIFVQRPRLGDDAPQCL